MVLAQPCKVTSLRSQHPQKPLSRAHPGAPARLAAAQHSLSLLTRLKQQVQQTEKALADGAGRRFTATGPPKVAAAGST